jgi:hypothetical protein
VRVGLGARTEHGEIGVPAAEPRCPVGAVLPAAVEDERRSDFEAHEIERLLEPLSISAGENDHGGRRPRLVTRGPDEEPEGGPGRSRQHEDEDDDPA